MWEKVLKALSNVVFVAEQARRNAEELKDLRDKHYELSIKVQRLALQIERIHENEAHEREKLTLRVENALLKMRGEKTQKPRDRKKLPR